jgi:hypothetical protein
MGEQELLERYEALGDERDFLAAKPLYEQTLGEAEDARLLNDFGYLLACHGRRECPGVDLPCHGGTGRDVVESADRAVMCRR